MSNKDLWDSVFKTDPNQTKPISGKDYQGTSVKPYFIVERLTDKFGPCGIGWGIDIISERFERFGDVESLHVAQIKLWYVLDGKRGEITQMGQTRASYVTSKGTYKVDEDAPKKSVTDAMTKCASWLGFAGDVFSGRWDDSKYVNDLKKEFAEEKKTITPTTGVREAIEPIRLSEIEKDAQQITGLTSMQDADTVLAILKDYKDQDEKAALWTFLDSKVRSWIKKVSADSIKSAGSPPKGATYVHTDLLACIETTDDQEALAELWTQCKTLYANADDGAGWSEFKAKFAAKAATLKKD